MDFSLWCFGPLRKKVVVSALVPNLVSGVLTGQVSLYDSNLYTVLLYSNQRILFISDKQGRPRIITEKIKHEPVGGPVGGSDSTTIPVLSERVRG